MVATTYVSLVLRMLLPKHRSLRRGKRFAKCKVDYCVHEIEMVIVEVSRGTRFAATILTRAVTMILETKVDG